jgi:branched-chain amino acid aminotransferase
MHRFLLHNDDILDASSKVLSPGQVGLLSGWGVFSTIKVVDGVLFAWERHWARMARDAALMRVPFPDDPDAMLANLEKLVEANGAPNATMRVVVVRNRGGMWEGPGINRDRDLIAFTTDLKDWGEGVELAVKPEARHSACNLAGTKILSWAMNLTWLEEAQSRGFDEVILLNERGEISECTSANIFIAAGSRVWTPPLTSGCLPGVTRELLLSEVHASGLEVAERTLKLSDLAAADEVMITSTTRDLLPVFSIEGMEIRRNDAVRLDLQKAFSAYIAGYVAVRKETATQRS